MKGRQISDYAALYRRWIIQVAFVLLPGAWSPLVAQTSPATSMPTSDVVVYGATPGGIAAAVIAARCGRSVTLVARNRRLGGMMASGLGKSDIENRSMIQGLFKEMVDRVRDHYVATYGASHENVKLCRDGYYYEPSVAEAVLSAMVEAESTLVVWVGLDLVTAHVMDGRIASIELRDRDSGATQRLAGKVFIDATYEGDLYAAAGAEFRIGREGRDEFDEPHAGVIYFDYREKQFLPGSTGAADGRLPAYTYRLCLTTDAENGVPLEGPPPEYDRGRYLGYFDDLEAGRLDAPKSYKPGRGYNPAHFGTLVRALSVTELPNRKTDVNINPRPLGFPFPEENRGYIEGDRATREKIAARHRNLTLGLLWFLQNDPEVPDAHRALANQLHLPRDEFVDNGHFPFQLYVREGRRLVGEYTLTEHDVTGDPSTGPRRHYDAIAIGEFPIDSFPCRRRQPGDSVVLEGYLGMLDHITRPYEIPYRIMVPRKVDGLLAPVAASTTHVGYSSIRMEPTWMALGQAAGCAAHLAIEHRTTPRDVSIDRLQQLLIQQKQVIRRPIDFDDPQMLDLADAQATTAIDYDQLPRPPLEHAIVSDVRDRDGRWVHQHGYLAYHAGQYWAMWSDGPGTPRAEPGQHRNEVPGHDLADTRVSYAVSPDGLAWSVPKPLSGPPRREGFGWIARGFWRRDDELLALASHFNAPGYPGKGLSLEAFRWDASSGQWVTHGQVLDDALNNFPPQRLPEGLWMMSRRDHRRQVTMMRGGVEAFDQWEVRPLMDYDGQQQPEEPYWYVLPGGVDLVGLLRDNAGSKRLLRTFSQDGGKTWTPAVRTNFPDATSKFFALRTSTGYYALVSNSNPAGRDPLTLALSPDGVVYTHLFYLVGGRHVDYPHMIEQDGSLIISFSGAKQTFEVVRIPLAWLDQQFARP